MRTNPREKHTVGLIGAGIGESLSPALHMREASCLGLEYEYRLLDLDELGREPEEVGSLVDEARRLGFSGLNVTHPCKQLVVPELDDLSAEAESLGAVNTIVFDGARAIGHNTDTAGFQEAFVRGVPGVATGDVVQLGAGGAGAAVAHAILGLGAARLTLLDVERDRAAGLAQTLEATFGAGRATAGDLHDLRSLLTRADGLIHATPTGMTGHPGTAVPRDLLNARLWVAEVVYFPITTRLLEDARAKGCRTLNGAPMVALQAAGSMELFTGLRPDRERMLRHVEELIADQRQAA
jgi:shikimate dehydrogenase